MPDANLVQIGRLHASEIFKMAISLELFRLLIITALKLKEEENLVKYSHHLLLSELLV